MATVVSRLEAVLTANTHDFEKKMDKSEHRMSGVGKAAAVAGTAIIGGLAVGLEKSVHAAMHAQVANARLDQAFKASHISATKYAKAVDGLESSGRKLGFTDEQTKDALGSLLIATHSMKKATADLSVSQDIARFKHVDLTTATKMLTMAQAGSQRATKQLGLTVAASTAHADAVTLAYKKQKEAFDQATPSMSKLSAVQQQHVFDTKDEAEVQYKAALAVARLTDKQVTSAKVIDLVRNKLHGQSEEYSKTAAGGMEVFKAQMEHLQVSMGMGVLPIMVKVTTALSGLTEWFGKHNDVARITIGVVGALGAAFLLTSVYAKIMASSLVSKVIPAIVKTTAVQWLLNVALTANPIGIVIVALAALGVAMVAAYYKVKFFRDGVNAAFSWIKEHWPLLVGIMLGPIGVIVEQIIVHRNQIVNIFKNLPGQMAAGFNAAKDALINKFKEIIHSLPKLVRKLLGIDSPSTVFAEIGKNVIYGMIKGLAHAAPALLNKAKSLFGSVTSAVGGLFGGPSDVKAGKGGSTLGTLVPWAQSEGMSITSTTGGHHVQGSYHYQGRAIDVSGSPDQMKKFFFDSLSHFGVGQIKELFYDPVNEYVKNGNLIRGSIGGHSDHVHLALGSGGIVTKAMTALIGERGPEAVIPLTSHRGQAALGGGNTYQFHFPNYIGSQNELAGQIFDVLQAYESRNGRSPGSGF